MSDSDDTRWALLEMMFPELTPPGARYAEVASGAAEYQEACRQKREQNARDRLARRMDAWGVIYNADDDFEALLDKLDTLIAAVCLMVPAGMYRIVPAAQPRAPKPPPPELP